MKLSRILGAALTGAAIAFTGCSKEPDNVYIYGLKNDYSLDQTKLVEFKSGVTQEQIEELLGKDIKEREFTVTPFVSEKHPNRNIFSIQIAEGEETYNIPPKVLNTISLGMYCDHCDDLWDYGARDKAKRN